MMWIICMFDIPVRTRKEMRKATRFRNVLLDEGFVMKQFSVYIKPVKSLSAGQTVTKRLSRFISDNSSVSFLYITDKQYLMTENYLGKNYEENEEEAREKKWPVATVLMVWGKTFLSYNNTLKLFNFKVLCY